jgi:RNA polymerase sigma-70 factor (ECF subfamily)
MEASKTASEAAQALFEAHGSAVYRFATVLLHHHQDAEDVVQETFLKLMRHLDAGGKTDNIRGWLFTVAAHASRDRQRRRARWISWAPRHEPSVEPSAPADEDGRIAAARAALQRLRKRDRLLLALRAHELSYRDIAAATGIRLTSVGRLLARAIARFERACAERAPMGVKPERHGLL